MLSLIVLTYRPGGIDQLAHFLQASLSKDYELVVVDDYPGRVERGLARKHLEACGIPVGWYGGSKHKFYYGTKGGLCNATNTALLHARGDYYVFLSDYTTLPKNWIAQWNMVRKMYDEKRTLVAGSAIMYDSPKPERPDDVVTWSKPVAIIPKWPWVASEFETFYYGAHPAFFDKINGLDERADHCHCWPVSSTVSQAKQLGYSLIVLPEVCCHMIDHRVWDNPDEPAPWGPLCGMWRIDHSQSIEKEPKWTVPSPNPWQLSTERAKIQTANNPSPR